MSVIIFYETKEFLMKIYSLRYISRNVNLNLSLNLFYQLSSIPTGQ